MSSTGMEPNPSHGNWGLDKLKPFDKLFESLSLKDLSIGYKFALAAFGVIFTVMIILSFIQGLFYAFGKTFPVAPTWTNYVILIIVFVVCACLAFLKDFVLGIVKDFKKINNS